MKACTLTLLVFLATPFLAVAQRKEYVQLQRDIAILQDQLQAVQKALDEKTAQLSLLIQQAVDGVNKSNTAVVALDNNLRDRMREQEKNVSHPVANIGSKVDQLTSEVQGIKESIAALTVRFGRIEQQMVDMSNAVKTLQAPPPPPGTEGAGAGVSSETLYQNALRDKNGGNFDLALKEFQEYLQTFGNTETAPNAQFYVGEIHYLRDNFNEAVKAFDLVLEKYPENSKTPDAHYMKAMALLKMGERAKGRSELNTLISHFPNSPLAAKAKDTLKGVGAAPARPAPKKRK